MNYRNSNPMVTVSRITISGELKCRDTNVLNYTINYPQIQCGECNRAADVLNRYYRAGAVDLKCYNEKQLYCQAVEAQCELGDDFRAFEAVTDYEITNNHNCVFSIYFDRYEFLGGAHGNTCRTSDTWNLQTASKLRLNDFFARNVNVKDYILDTISEQICCEIYNSKADYFDDWRKLIRKCFDPCNFFITPEGVHFYYQQYDIAPYAAGIKVFCIPFDGEEVIAPCCRG